jgi:glycosyltransferase involved in cell wall biosynthesis
MTGAEQPRRLRVALDATPLLGYRTGVGAFCAGALHALSERPELDVQAYAVSWRRRAGIDASVPSGVVTRQRAMPARPLHALWRRADVVHGTNFVVPPTRRAAAVVSVHDLTPLHHPELCNAATLAYPGLIRRAVARGAWIHADSEFVADEVREAFGVEADRVRVVAPGVPSAPALSPAEADQLVAPLLPPRTDRYVLAIGTAEPRKDLPGLVRAFDALAARIDGLALVLAGPEGWGEAALTDALARAAHADRIIRTGWVDAPLLAALTARAAVLAYPSLYEGFGFPPLQAMAAGVPVVATRAGSLLDVLGDGADLVEPGDADALGAALESVLVDQGHRRQLIQAGSRRAAHYSWSACGEGLAQLYSDLVDACG